jgi:hypothetical protein
MLGDIGHFGTDQGGNVSRIKRLLVVATISLFGVGLLPATPAQACAGELCDVVNRVCDIADLKKDYHWQCVA